MYLCEGSKARKRQIVYSNECFDGSEWAEAIPQFKIGAARAIREVSQSYNPCFRELHNVVECRYRELLEKGIGATRKEAEIISKKRSRVCGRAAHILVITWSRVPYAKYRRRSDVMLEGRRPSGITSLLHQYLAYAHEGPCN